MKAIIIDDSIAATKALQEKLNATYHDIQVVATAMMGSEGLDLVNKFSPELLFLDVLWPDITDADLDAAFADFARRDRRFGNVPQRASA